MLYTDYNDHHAINSRLLKLSESPSAGCDPEFDTHDEGLEREFAELRLQLANFD